MFHSVPPSLTVLVSTRASVGNVAPTTSDFLVPGLVTSSGEEAVISGDEATVVQLAGEKKVGEGGDQEVRT